LAKFAKVAYAQTHLAESPMPTRNISLTADQDAFID